MESEWLDFFKSLDDSLLAAVRKDAEKIKPLIKKAYKEAYEQALLEVELELLAELELNLDD